jgi:manganese transport protein
MCREQLPQPVVWAIWVISEVAAMATDLAEFLGGAIGLSLLFQMPLLAGMVVTAVVTYGILMFESSGFRPIELIIGSLVGINQARPLTSSRSPHATNAVCVRSI